MVVVRPHESSGTNGSGVELRNVTYRGRSLLARAHVPILNVQYQEGTGSCGPTYRDWLWQETCFEVLTGNDVIPGFRLAKRPPQTLIESGEDGGNFRGVAVHFDGEDLVLTSEMRAGWYRYVTHWRLSPDGTIRSRMGISAVRNPCTCQLHVHHAYFRFDFDVDGVEPNFVEEFNDSGLLGLGLTDEWLRLPFEVSRTRDPDAGRHWRVGSDATGATCLVTPGHHDGTADRYGVNDTWHLRFHADEIDDGRGTSSTSSNSTQAGLDRFADGESIDGEDVVLWYGAHHEHDQVVEPTTGEYIGPILSPSWGDGTSQRLKLKR